MIWRLAVSAVTDAGDWENHYHLEEKAIRVEMKEGRYTNPEEFRLIQVTAQIEEERKERERSIGSRNDKKKQIGGVV